MVVARGSDTFCCLPFRLVENDVPGEVEASRKTRGAGNCSTDSSGEVMPSRQPATIIGMD